MDYKNPERWAAAFPGLPYPGNGGEDQIYTAFGYKISASNLGNLNAGVVGKAYGFSEFTLLWQAGAAHLRDHEPYYNLPISQIEALKIGPEYFYGDSAACNEYVRYGFGIYNQYRRGRR